MQELLDYYIKRRKDIHLVGRLEIPLQRRLEAEGYRIFDDPAKAKDHKESIPGPVVVLTKDDVEFPDFSCKLTLPDPIERPWCYQWCLESVCPFFIDTEKERCLNAAADTTCHYCKDNEYFICKYDECCEMTLGRTGVEDVDLAGHDYTDCRKRCRIKEMTDGEKEPCPDGQTIYEKIGWTFETEDKPATFKGRIVK